MNETFKQRIDHPCGSRRSSASRTRLRAGLRGGAASSGVRLTPHASDGDHTSARSPPKPHRSRVDVWCRQTLRARRCALLSKRLLDDYLSLLTGKRLVNSSGSAPCQAFCFAPVNASVLPSQRASTPRIKTRCLGTGQMCKRHASATGNARRRTVPLSSLLERRGSPAP